MWRTYLACGLVSRHFATVWSLCCTAANCNAVFSRCAGSLEEGRRLENLSWRLWNRETFCCQQEDAKNATPAISIAPRSSAARSTSDIPDLSGSVDSLADEEAIEFDSEETAATSAPLNILRPLLKRQDSSNISTQSRGRERHITPDDLEKMVTIIKEKKALEPLPKSLLASVAELPRTEPIAEPITAPVPIEVEDHSATPHITSPKSSPAVTSDSASGTSERSTTSVVRGFSPSHISSSYRSIPLDVLSPVALPVATSDSHAPPKKNVFALGGSSQSGDDSYIEPSSLEARMQQQQPQKRKNTVFTFGGSSGEEESSFREEMLPTQPHRSSLSAALRGPPPNKKQTSFKNEVATRTIPEDRAMDDDVFETDEEDEIDESAIDDDDDSSDWEDSVEESGKSSFDDKALFKRVDSRPNLTSRRSLLTTMLHQNDRAAQLATLASQSTPALQRSKRSSPNGPSLAASPDSDDNVGLMMKKGLKPAQDVPRSAAQPIIQTPTNITAHQLALSPKTTRRNMLQTELTASLRRHLLWERQQKNQTAAAVLKRRHTAHDVANLKQYPEKVHMGPEDNETYGSWNQFNMPGLGDFHSKGW
jgi:hypothetical protein